MVRAQMAAPPLSNSDNVVGELDVLPSGNPSVFLESEDGVDVAVKEPETIPGSVHVAVAAGDLLEASSASNSQLQPALCDRLPVDVVIDIDSGGGEMVPDGDEVLCLSDSSASSDDSDEDVKDGDSTCFCEEPFYSAKEPSKSVSRKYGVEVSRHDIAFVRDASRLMCLWEGESHLVFGIGGHLRTVVDWYLVRGRNAAAVAGWLPVSDPARPDVPLWIEFTAVYGQEKVVAGTALQRPNESLVLWIYMLNSNRVGAGVNTQFFWCADGPPRGFWTSVPILCRVTVYNLPVGTEMWFDIDAVVRKQYSWSDVASQFAQECNSWLDAGEDARNVQYSIIRGRAPGLPWAYGGTFASVSRYVEPMQSEPPVERERIRARVLHGGKGLEASSSSQVMPAGNSERRTGRRRVSGVDKWEALWRRAFDPDTGCVCEQQQV